MHPGRSLCRVLTAGPVLDESLKPETKFQHMGPSFLQVNVRQRVREVKGSWMLTAMDLLKCVTGVYRTRRGGPSYPEAKGGDVSIPP
jgi:hypothetical protein